MRLITDGSHVDLAITLVHGTWGRGLYRRRSSRTQPRRPRKPGWFETGSRFRSTLKELLSNDDSDRSYSVDVFEWSGANSFIERARAATDLAKRLDQQASTDPSRTQILIGHSHGGTVCMLACRELKAARPHLVTLATPFIELDASDAGSRTLMQSLANQLRGSSVVSFFFIIPLTVIASVAPALPFSFLHHWWMPYLLALPFGYLGIDAWDHWSRTRLSPVWAGGGLIQALTSTRIFVLRGVDDEATLTLTAAAIANRLCQPVIVLAVFAFWLSVFLVLILRLSHGTLFQIDSRTIHLRLVQTLPLAWLLDVITGVLMSTSGRELALWFHGLQIRSHSSPDHARYLSVFTLPYRGRRGLMRHALYDHDLATPLIALWIKNDFALCPADLDYEESPPGTLRISLAAKRGDGRIES